MTNQPNAVEIVDLLEASDASTLRSILKYCTTKLMENDDMLEFYSALLVASLTQKSSSLAEADIWYITKGFGVTNPELGMLLQVAVAISILNTGSDKWKSVFSDYLVDFDTFQLVFDNLKKVVVGPLN